jgi:hypothetical protein
VNAGFSNLTTLKANILPQTMIQGTHMPATAYDAKLMAIGLMIASMFDQYCNRGFTWTVNATDIFTGDRPQWYVKYYPIATNNDANQSPQITSVNMRYFLTDNWTNIVGEPLQVDATKGKIHFGYTLGRAPLQVQAIYNGGFWFQTAEPTDENYPTAQPAGSVALPNDIFGAWILQVSEVWAKIDKLGSGITGKPDLMSNLGALDLVPMVKQMLRQYIRYQMT